MPQTFRPYAGQAVALATRHGKQRVIGRALRHGLGAELLHLPQLDTDQLGTFCGTVARQGTALEACIAKAELALAHGGTGLAIASEGSFGPHPAVPLLPLGLEVMVFLDSERGLTIHEQLQARRTNFAQRRLTAASLESEAGAADLERWLSAVGFPSHALIVRPLETPLLGNQRLDNPAVAGPRPGEPLSEAASAGDQAPSNQVPIQQAPGDPAGAALIRKGIRTHGQLRQAIRLAAAQSPSAQVQLETDMRAHCNPTRMASIRQLSFRLVRRIASPCPGCQAPGWGLIASEPGLPCAWCGLPTALTRAEIHGCVRCDERRELPRRDGLRQADPGHCPHCNP